MVVLTPDLLLSAYASGLFPMANDRHDPTVHWIEPRRRGVLPLDRFHVPRSLRRTLRSQRFEICFDRDFEQVIRACAEPRPERPRTWLNDELIDLYCVLHQLGHAHSVETWADGRLAGGLYGVSLGTAFFGESMFTRERDASKVALVALVERLRRAGYGLLDTQFVTDHLRRFGAVEITRDRYRQLLRRALQRRASFYGDEVPSVSIMPWTVSPAASGSSQSTTQRSYTGCSRAETAGLEANIQPLKISMGASSRAEAGGSSRISRKAALSGGSVGGVSRQVRAMISNRPK
jgi:leucyl/phenylalanyl-tRNA--protein transferase